MNDLKREVVMLRESRAEAHAELNRLRQLIWMLVASAGGEIRIPYTAQQDMWNPGRDLSMDQDIRTQETVYRARLK